MMKKLLLKEKRSSMSSLVDNGVDDMFGNHYERFYSDKGT